MLIKITTLIAILISLTGSPAIAQVDCEKHKIYCQIKKNHPKIDDKKAMEISNIIFKVSNKYDIPSNIYTAILMQESGYILDAENCHYGVLKDTETKAIVCVDIGIAQINVNTIESYGFNMLLLLSDLEYSIDAGAKVLQWFHQTYKHKEPSMWFTRYNCGTKPSINRETCKRYGKLVRRYL